MPAVPKPAATRHRPRTPGQLPAPDTPPKGADVTREKLLQATHELLFELGGEEPSVSQICERADVRVAMVSYCFGSKAGLLEALGERTITHMMAEEEHLIALGLPPEEALALHVRAMVLNFVRYPYFSSLSERIAAGDPTATGMAQTVARPTIDFYRDLLAQGAASGVFRDDVDPTLLWFSIVGMCEFIFNARSWLTETGETLNDALVDRFVAHTVELVLHGLAPAPDAANV